MIRKNNFLAAAVLAALVLGSCSRHPGESVRRSVLYNNEVSVDTEGYVFFKSVHEKAQFETQLAKQVQAATASAAAKELAGKIAEFYGPIASELESLASGLSVVLPDPGVPGFAVPQHVHVDSLGSVNSDQYIAHVQHEQAAIMEQLNRASRNTNRALRQYAEGKIPAVEALFAAAGGEVSRDGGHH